MCPGDGPQSGTGSLREALEAHGYGEALCQDVAAVARGLTPILMSYADWHLAVEAVKRATPAAKREIYAYLHDLLGAPDDDIFGGKRDHE